VTRRRRPPCPPSAPAPLTLSGMEWRQPSHSRRSTDADSVTRFGEASRPPAWRGPCNASTGTADRYGLARSGLRTDHGSSCYSSTKTPPRWWRAPESGRPNRGREDQRPTEGQYRQHAFQLVGGSGRPVRCSSLGFVDGRQREQGRALTSHERARTSLNETASETGDSPTGAR
jgi:hypothetical protein